MTASSPPEARPSRESTDAAPRVPVFARPGEWSLTRRFSILGVVTIAIVFTVTTFIVSRFLVEEMLRRDAELTSQFAQNVANQMLDAMPPGSSEAARLLSMRAFFERITSMPEVLRANVYGLDRQVLWSSNSAIIGKIFEFNPELDEALAGRLAIEAAILERRDFVKPEHVFLGAMSGDFVEYYVPVWDLSRSRVLGVVELYKEPAALYNSIYRGVRTIWVCVTIGALILFAALLVVVRRADLLIRDQRRELVTNETFAAIGEVASAIAHNIRNPLASIRTSAELLDDGRPESGARDIIGEVDRVEAWVRNLLTYTQVGTRASSQIDVNATVRASMHEFGRDFERQRIALDLDFATDLPSVVVDPMVLPQILHTLVGNAVDAMPNGGRITITTQRDDPTRTVVIAIADNGPGMSPDQLERAFIPFQSTKKYGIGIGLPLVRRTLHRLGGAIQVTSATGVGTTARVSLPAA